TEPSNEFEFKTKPTEEEPKLVLESKKEEAKVEKITTVSIEEVKEEERVEEPKPLITEESKKEEKTKEEKPKKEEAPVFNFDYKGAEFDFGKTNDFSTSFSFGVSFGEKEEPKKEEPKKEEAKKEEKKEESKKTETPFTFETFDQQKKVDLETPFSFVKKEEPKKEEKKEES